MNSAKLFVDSMPERTRRVFEVLSMDDRLPKGFFLIGGTGLSLQLNHRLSEDLDFVIANDRLPVKHIDELIEHLSMDHSVTLVTPISAVHDFIDSGLDVGDYHQDWLIDGVKVTFFCFGEDVYYEKSVIKLAEATGDFSSYGNILIPSVKAIAMTKCAVMCRRIKSRDIFDLNTLIQREVMTFQEVIAEMLKVKPLFTYEHLTHRLISAQIPDDDEGLTSVSDTGINAVRQQLQDKKDEAEATVFNCLAAELPGA